MFATGIWDFNVYRFLCGLGVGGQFAVGVALVAEVVPARARPYALGLVQAASAIGNMMAADAGIVLGQMEQAGVRSRAPGGMSSWPARCPRRWRFVVFKKLKEPEQWLKARAEKKRMGSFAELFSDPRWRRNSIVGLLLAFAGVVGLWGIGFFSYDLFRPVLEKTFQRPGLDRRGAGRQGHHLDRRHVAAAEPRRVLRHLRVHLSDPLHGPPERVRRQLRGRDGHDGIHVLEPERAQPTSSG